MTNEEYQALYDEYHSTDSISKREEIEEKIGKAALELFTCVRDIFDKYHARKKLIYNDDYRDDRGFTCLAHEDDGSPMIEKGVVYLRYSDTWRYGGYCSFTITLYTKWFDPEERKKLDRVLKAERIKTLKNSVESLKEEIAHKECLLKEYGEAISKMESEEDFADSMDAEDDEPSA